MVLCVLSGGFGMAASCGNNRGFTLIELAIVMIISGLVMAAGFQAYNTYLNDVRSRESYEKQKIIYSALSAFASNQQRLPCPANPQIPVSDPASGMEIPIASCTALRSSGTAYGTCMDGVCRVEGERDADGDGANDAVLIGAVPYADIKRGQDTAAQRFEGGIATVSILDPWGYQMTYAVSALMTSASTYRPEYGAISVTTENPLVSVVKPAGSAQYVIVAHGDNHAGAYTAEGAITTPCIAGVAESANCDGGGAYVSGLRSLGPNADYFDDVVWYNSFSISMLWDFVPGGNGDIYNKNAGNVGIGTDNPSRELEVAGNVAALGAYQDRLCSSSDPTVCWSPDILAAPLSTGLSLNCPDTNTPGFRDVVLGITSQIVTVGTNTYTQPTALCGLAPEVTPIFPQSCPANEYVSGFTPSGNIMCDPRPVPP